MGDVNGMADGDSSPDWFEEKLDDDLKWSFTFQRALYTGTSPYQEITLLDTKIFGKVLVLDGKMQSAERDEFIYHECLIHPSLLCHSNPKSVFIMGGGEGLAAREALRHNLIEQVVMCDINREVVDFCKKHLTGNREAFASKKLKLVINDAKAELETTKDKFDIIVGYLSDPVGGGPCYQLYTKSFYQNVIKPRLNHDGIFIAQGLRASSLTRRSSLPSTTLSSEFSNMWCHTQLMSHLLQTHGAGPWPRMNLLISDADEIDRKIKERIDGELQYLNGPLLVSSTIMNKMVLTSLLNETHVYTEGNARFVHGQGVAHRR